MFEFLGERSFIHLIKDFMHEWHKGDADEQEGLRRKRLEREHDEKRKKTKLIMEEAAAEVDEVDLNQRATQQKRKVQAELDERLGPAVMLPTLTQISEGTGLTPKQVRDTLKVAEQNQFVHFPHPEHPDQTRYALRVHAEEFGLQNWQPGTGF